MEYHFLLGKLTIKFNLMQKLLINLIFIIFFISMNLIFVKIFILNLLLRIFINEL